MRECRRFRFVFGRRSRESDGVFGTREEDMRERGHVLITAIYVCLWDKVS